MIVFVHKSKPDLHILMEQVYVLSSLTAGETHMFSLVPCVFDRDISPTLASEILTEIVQETKVSFPWNKSVSERNVSGVAKGVN